MRSLLVAALCFAVATATGLNVDDKNAAAVVVAEPKALVYEDMDTLWKDVNEHPEWFGFSEKTVAEAEAADNTNNLSLGAYDYTYSQRSGRFTGPSFNGGSINIVGCSGASGSCRNNPSCQCQKNVGPLPQGGYALSSMITFKGMPYCYALSQVSGNACGRSGFLIHGGSCSANPSEGCIVIPDQNVRYQIKGGGHLTVTA